MVVHKWTALPKRAPHRGALFVSLHAHRTGHTGLGGFVVGDTQGVQE
jgi:hypothetical protein